MQPNDFFVAGGTLRAQSPSYVQRPADDALLTHLLAGEFCYVLTPRQMGKSSLMVRTAARLREQAIQTVIIDLTSIGSVPVDEWYLGLLSRIRSGLRLEVDVQAWWQAQAVGPAQRFSTFLRDEVLSKIDEQIVIFIDEIDSTLNLEFRDDFFAAVRALYNARANDPIYQRLTFAFLGVATPTELIQDRERTPFNIGRRIDLQEFSFADARPLQDGLESILPKQGETLLQRIFHWTSGHPYLTQKLCLSIASHPEQSWDASVIDQLVARSLLSEEGRKDTNLTFVQDRILSSPAAERSALLTLYRQVYNGKRLPDDDRSPVQNRLELYGLLKVKDGVLHLRNEIYRRVFNVEWITANTPVNSRRRTAIGAVVIALLLVSLSVFYFAMQPAPGCDVFVKQFVDNPETQTVRISALASLFSGGCDSDALKLFYDLPKAEQKKLFLFENPQSVQANLRTVVEKLSRTLDWADDGHDLKLMEGMMAQLQRAGIAESDSLVQMLQHWHDGREMARAKNFGGAVAEYTIAMQLIEDNAVLRYDRALSFIELENFPGAYVDFDEIVRIIELDLPTSTPSLVLSPTLMISTSRTTAITDSNNEISSITIIRVAGDVSFLSEEQSYQTRFSTSESIIETVRETILNRLRPFHAIDDYKQYPHLESLALDNSVYTPSPPGLVTSFETFVQQPDQWVRGNEPWGNFTPSKDVVAGGAISGKLEYDFSTATRANDYVVFLAKPPLPIPNQAYGLSMQVYGDGSENFLNAWVIDSNRYIWQFTFGRITHNGWAEMSAPFDLSFGWPNGLVSGNGSEIVYPVRLFALTLDGEEHAVVKGIIYVDEIFGIYAIEKSTISRGNTPTPPPPWVKNTKTPETNFGKISCGADPGTIAAGQATNIFWQIIGVRAVYLGNEGVAGIDKRWVFPKQTTTYQLRIVTTDGSETSCLITVQVH